MNNSKIIYNKREFEDFYYYKTSTPDNYPKKYPCIVTKIDEDGGIGGSYVRHEIVYFPKNVNKTCFFKGYVIGRKEV